MSGRAGDPAELLALAEGGTAGNRRSLARLLSVVERGGPAARQLEALTYPRAGSTYTIGLTGAPGAGKSTLTGRIVAEALDRTGGPVAVLAVDPSSPLSGGAILGDRVRMQDHALDPNVFIRSMATRGHLGGLAAAVPDAVRLLDAAGWPLVLVETVGVGQVEVEVAGTCDTIVVVLNPGWGDAVQANKAGLLEVADVLVINKADRPGVRETRQDLVHMLQLTGVMEWTPPIVETVASTGQGLDELWEAIASHRDFLGSEGRLERRRQARMAEETERLCVDAFGHLASVALGRRDPRETPLGEPEAEKLRAAGRDLLERLARREIDPVAAADELAATLAGLIRFGQ
ncbi:MAG TPA: methylmalonyl Co-A mutase-associated GTPase MeaB [Acidimicrobiales bacterium]|nr:methylmalonyl Co-A mutase-associated GTPase MeaB [Acidimicrobiales bacterium]